MSVQGAHEVAERIRAEFDRTIAAMADVTGRLSLSIGVADSVAGSPSTADDMVRLADGALYRAKAGGKSRVVVADAA